nr:zinc finger, CCHC-type [Tanacetum cinerariifolium]
MNIKSPLGVSIASSIAGNMTLYHSYRYRLLSRCTNLEVLERPLHHGTAVLGIFLSACLSFLMNIKSPLGVSIASSIAGNMTLYHSYRYRLLSRCQHVALSSDMAMLTILQYNGRYLLRYLCGFPLNYKVCSIGVAGKEAKWLRNLIHKILIWWKPIALISIHCNSAATLAKAYSQIYNGKSRHLGVRYSMIKEIIMNGIISIEFVRSQDNLADQLIKGLARDLVINCAFFNFYGFTGTSHDPKSCSHDSGTCSSTPGQRVALSSDMAMLTILQYNGRYLLCCLCGFPLNSK